MFLLVDKPKGMTSHGVVNYLRIVTGEKRIGHAGTLDPNATGLLIIGIGRQSTKQLDKFLKLDKQYLAQIMLGEERDTDDVEGVVRKKEFANQKSNLITKNNLEKIIKSLVGQQKQTPPIYSAIKVNGKEAYKLARKGKVVSLRPRKIIVHKAELLNFKFPLVEIKFEVSSGTYIRSLARDFGRKLKLGGYLENLRRIKIGKYNVDNAVLLDELKANNWMKFVFDI